MLIRQAQVSDFPRVLEINQTEEEKTSRIDLARITQLDLWSDYHRVAVVDDEVVGFLLVMSETSEYDGANFRWFVERYSRFLYVDRIVIDGSAARLGVGSPLYRDLIQFAATRRWSTAPRRTSRTFVSRASIYLLIARLKKRARGRAESRCRPRRPSATPTDSPCLMK